MKKVFVSHRCIEYHRSNLPAVIELLLKENNLEPIYGCQLNKDNAIGFVPENVGNAAQTSDCYLGIIQKSWMVEGLLAQITDLGARWPRTEWALWQKAHPNSRNFLILIVDTAHCPGFINQVVRHPVSTQKTDIANVPLVDRGGEATLWSSEDVVHLIKHGLALFSQS